MRTELPPELKKGRVMPRTGSSRTVIPMLITDWKPISDIMPTHMNSRAAFEVAALPKAAKVEIKAVAYL